MKRQAFKISISKLLILSNCLIMAAFFCISSFFSQRSYQKVLDREFEVKQYQMLVYISDTLDKSMNSIELLARSTANNYNIINNILNYKKNSNSYEQMVFQNNMNQNLSSLAYTMGDIVSVNILMEDENLKTTRINGVYHYENYTGEESCKRIQNMSSGWITTRENDLLNQVHTPYINTYVMRIYSGLYYGEGIGHLVINLNENLFYNQMKEYCRDDESTILFIDDQDNIISSTDRSVIGKRLPGTAYDKYRKILTGKQNSDTESRLKIFNQKQLKEHGYYVMAVTDYDKAVAAFKQTQKMVLISSIGLLCLFVVFSAFLAYKISKPILMLSKEVTNFKGRGWSRRTGKRSRIYEIDVLCTEFDHMTTQIDDLIKSLLKQEKLKQKKELEILQAQINPHFLYNTLEAINWMALSMKQKEISNMVILLGNFLRLSLNKGKNVYFVSDELNHLKSYMDIQNIRCRGKIEFSLDADSQVLKFRIIKLLLQPLVENSILHGFDFRGGAGQIWVKAFAEEDYIYFTVTDDGCGMEPELVEAVCDMNSDVGHGLKNVMKRIGLYYGEGCGLTIQSTMGVGTAIEIKILNEVPNQQI
ncbi:MAG: histidine kinase [Lacrimispora sp.]